MEQAWIDALLGGIIIGVASTVLLWGNGRITGISGILFGAIKPTKGDTLWRLQFLLGLLLGGVLLQSFAAEAFINTADTPLWLVAVAGALVGFGTRLGSGCTSGHGVCGISRVSIRSVVATVSFITSGVLTVLATHLWGAF